MGGAEFWVDVAGRSASGNGAGDAYLGKRAGPCHSRYGPRPRSLGAKIPVRNTLLSAAYSHVSKYPRNTLLSAAHVSAA